MYQHDMMYFFDYFYFKTCEFYLKNENDTGSYGLSALLMVSGFQAININTIYMFAGLLLENKTIITKWVGVSIWVLVLFIDFLRYNKKRHYNVLEKEIPNSKKIRSGYLLAYCSISLVLFFGIAIYSGSKLK
jgi:hypothetical protein